MEIRAEEISQIIRKQIEEYDQKVTVVETTIDDLKAIPGSPPAVGEFPTGCPFAPRCPSSAKSAQFCEPLKFRPRIDSAFHLSTRLFRT